MRARIQVALAGYQAEFVEGHELDQKTAAKIPKKKIGTPLSRKQAEDLLAKL